MCEGLIMNVLGASRAARPPEQACSKRSNTWLTTRYIIRVLMHENHHQAVVFDFGGVLVDWNPYYLYRKLLADDDAAIARFLTEIGFHEWNLQQDNGRSFDEGVAVLSAQFPQYAELIRAYHLRYEEAITGPIRETVEVLRALKEAGYPLYGLSNWSTEKFNLVRPKYEFFNWFDDIVISAAVKLVKPDPKIFALFLQQIQRTAEECVYIDDSAVNVEIANRLGFTAIHFTSPAQLRTELNRLGFCL
jgi:2-haloacid dehalogenase